MSKKKRNVFNLPEALYRGILEDVHNDPDLYINPDPTVREDIHYIAYTLYAQRPSDRELSRNYIIALGEMGKLCDEIERLASLLSVKLLTPLRHRLRRIRKLAMLKKPKNTRTIRITSVILSLTFISTGSMRRRPKILWHLSIC